MKFDNPLQIRFVSDEMTGTGDKQIVSHQVGAPPQAVLIIPTDFLLSPVANPDQDVVVNVPAGRKFVVVGLY